MENNIDVHAHLFPEDLSISKKADYDRLHHALRVLADDVIKSYLIVLRIEPSRKEIKTIAERLFACEDSLNVCKEILVEIVSDMEEET